MRIGAGALLITLVITAGCAGSGTAIGGGGGGLGSGGTSFADKKAAAQEVSSYASTLDPLNQADFQTKVAAHMRGMAAFKDVVISNNVVSASYQDGQPYAVLNNLLPSPGGPVPVSTRPLAHELPGVGSYSAVHALGNAYTDQTGLIGGWLEGSGYVGGKGGIKVKDWPLIAAHGVVYMTTHGGFINGRFGLWTSDKVGDPVADAANKPYLDEHTVIWCSAIQDRKPGGYTYEDHYMVTPEFIKKYVSFPKNAFLCLSACSGDNATLTSVLSAKNVSGFAGWSGTVNDGAQSDCARLIFDRLLGMNKERPESPFQRPFDIEAVASDLEGRGLLSDSVNHTQCHLKVLQGDFGLLDPTIQSMTVRAYDRELELAGDFGTKQGKVTINGNPISVKSWAQDKIVCDLPDTGSAAAGDVEVNVDGRESNDAALTLWKGDLVYEDRHTALGSSVVIRCTWHISIRGDVRKYRTTPHQDPSGYVIFSPADRTSTCTWSASGAEGFGQVAWTGSGTLPQVGPGPSTEQHLFKIGYTIDVENKKVQLGFIAFDKAGIHVTGNPSPIDFGPSGEVFDENPGPHGLLTLDMTMNDDYSIRAGSRSKLIGPGGDEYTLTWNKMTAAFVPEGTEGT
jgi:hypothetical protein